ncbi:hypothetical protein DL769_008816 [Monosporascus sp. CRB-8-3]|nr:hypothetical protein DL769_008816 [Monosporascus sp. CRB-8-3]
MESSEECRYTLAPGNSGLSTHLRQKHQVPDYRRWELTWFLRHHGPSLGLHNPTEAPPRADGTPEDPRLRIYDGYACRLCRGRTIHHPTIERHVAADWIVERNDTTDWLVGGQNVRAHLGCLPTRESEPRQQLQPEGPEKLGTAPASTLAELRTWLRRTRWEETYQHVNREVLSAMAAMPHPAALPRPVVLGRCGNTKGKADKIASDDTQQPTELSWLPSDLRSPLLVCVGENPTLEGLWQAYNQYEQIEENANAVKVLSRVDRRYHLVRFYRSYKQKQLEAGKSPVNPAE